MLCCCAKTIPQSQPKHPIYFPFILTCISPLDCVIINSFHHKHTFTTSRSLDDIIATWEYFVAGAGEQWHIDGMDGNCEVWLYLSIMSHYGVDGELCWRVVNAWWWWWWVVVIGAAGTIGIYLERCVSYYFLAGSQAFFWREPHLVQCLRRGIP